MAFFTLSCISSEQPKGIRISGAWALYPMAVKWAEEYQKVYPDVKIDVSAGGTGKGMTDALGGLVDIGMVSRDIYPQEVEKGAFVIPVVKDAVFPTVSENNPVLGDLLSKGVKRQTLMDIYITGKITTWGEVVGKPEIKDKIEVYTRSDACGAAETWAKYLDKKQEDLRGIGVYGDPGLAYAVKKDPLGIGYNNLNYAYDAKTGKAVQGIVVLPFDVNENGRVDPEEDLSTKTKAVEAVAEGRYPSPPARELYLVTKNKPSGLTKAFIEWILKDGQKYVDETGYIQLPNERLNEALKKLE
jgi:phosphate transport system substrate-binding protein